MSTSFVGLLATQLLSVINDNVFRWLVIGIGKGLILNASNESAILMIGSNCFILPYLILAAPAGYLADRYSKRSVIVGKGRGGHNRHNQSIKVRKVLVPRPAQFVTSFIGRRPIAK